ncbi:MAG TPA: DUF1697 domain-containing protein [Candidatus Sulfotelmatobacter sp.]|nr:DUF1697 domain-containing protein [Candidatus Sulfotelmatobacter sp.]
MPTYVALLRGINLGPNKRVKMDALRKSFESLGLKNVQTYIQSGNVIFKAGRMSSIALRKKIEARITEDFGFSALTILRSREELGKVVEMNPFQQPEVSPAWLHVIFLLETPDAAVLKQLEGLTKAPDKSSCLGQQIYLHLPNGYAHSSLLHNPLERKLLTRATTRNWRTVNSVYQMCLDCE